MIELSFIMGSAIRRVIIDEKVIKMMSSETGFTPIEIDLNKLDDEMISKMKNIDKEILREIMVLQTEEEISKDITKDFQKSGWRLFKKNGRIS